MELTALIAVIRTRVRLIITCLVVTTAVAFGASLVLPASYEASAKLIAGPALGTVNITDVNQLQSAQQIAATYAAAVQTQELAQAVISKLGLSTAPTDLLKQISTTVDSNAPLITIKVDDPDARRAADIANAVGDQLIALSATIQGKNEQVIQAIKAQITTVQGEIAADQPQIDALKVKQSAGTITPAEQATLLQLQQEVVAYQGDLTTLLTTQSTTSASVVSFLDHAVTPPAPASPKLLLNVILGLVLGTVLGLGLAFAAAALDDTFKSVDELQEALHLPVLGTLGRLPEAAQQSGIYRLVMLLYPRSAAAEAFRTMRTNVDFADVDSGLKSLLVTSPTAGDGKSTVAANLALAFAQAGRRTILVDADLRKPSVHEMFDQSNTFGLTSLIRSEVIDLGHVLRTVDEPNLRLLTSGPLPPNPAELLGSNRMRTIIEALEGQADLVIFDSPPSIAVTDAAVLASLIDGTIVVVAAGQTRRDHVRQTDETMGRVGGRVIGAILNRIHGRDRDATYDAYPSERPAESGAAGLTQPAKTAR